jgi:hypothetical protein
MNRMSAPPQCKMHRYRTFDEILASSLINDSPEMHELIQEHGDIPTHVCNTDECVVCSLMDCPAGWSIHYDKDGCFCAMEEQGRDCPFDWNLLTGCDRSKGICNCNKK